jgi:hypothetical protein
MHADADDAFVYGRNVESGQGRHAVGSSLAPRYVPAAQMVHLEEAARGAAEPGAHVAHASADLAPAEDENVPGEHCAQVVDPGASA